MFAVELPHPALALQDVPKEASLGRSGPAAGVFVATAVAAADSFRSENCSFSIMQLALMYT